MTCACLVLPFPPTTNNLFAGKEKRHRSRAYKDWHVEAYAAYLRQPRPRPITGPVRLDIALGKPDRRRRDVSNYVKALEDFIVKDARVLEDDSQVEDLHVYWCTETVGARVYVEPLATRSSGGGG